VLLRRRRYRERHRNDNAQAGRNGKRNGKRNSGRQRIDVTSGLKIRNAAQAAGQVAELIEFPASGRLAEVTGESVTKTPPEATVTAPRDERPSLPLHSSIADLLAYGVACGLAGIAAWFSLRGLAVLFPGAPHEIIVMGAIMEAAKLIACGWLAGAWRQVPWAFRGVLMLLIAGLAVINASGTFSQLTAAHVGNRAVSSATLTIQGADLDARIEVAGANLADLDRRLDVMSVPRAPAARWRGATRGGSTGFR
jgi:hypothetical protein